MKLKIFHQTLGCPKNEVDSNIMIGRLIQEGFFETQNEKEADIIIINTCSFIEDAVNESIDMILELAQLKKKGKCKKLIVTGCLPQRYGSEIAKTLPEVDYFLGTNAFYRIVEIIKICLQNNYNLNYCIEEPDLIDYYKNDFYNFRFSKTYYSYIKIAEGCGNKCTYCIIPKLRGSLKSRNADNIINESLKLVNEGTKELILVAQDITKYGRDLKTNLCFLLEKLVDKLYINNKKIRVRLLYLNPEDIDDQLINLIANNEIICSYLEIPVQHVSDSVLKKMGRHYREYEIRKLVEKIRSKIVNAAIRTTVMVGFPGEKEKDFKKLSAFIQDIKFDHLGAFMYSDSNDLKSHKLKNHVPLYKKQERMHEIMTAQADISLLNNQKYIGKKLTVLIDGKSLDEPFLWEAKSYFQAPEIDGITLIKNGKFKTGDWANVKITDAMHYDIIGEAI